jgi:hypothetical protein
MDSNVTSYVYPRQLTNWPLSTPLRPSTFHTFSTPFSRIFPPWKMSSHIKARPRRIVWRTESTSKPILVHHRFQNVNLDVLSSIAILEQNIREWMADSSTPQNSLSHQTICPVPISICRFQFASILLWWKSSLESSKSMKW